jgi:hypothetical protein
MPSTASLQATASPEWLHRGSGERQPGNCGPRIPKKGGFLGVNPWLFSLSFAMENSPFISIYSGFTRYDSMVIFHIFLSVYPGVLDVY